MPILTDKEQKKAFKKTASAESDKLLILKAQHKLVVPENE